jgi:phosphoglycolate phosphatase-like HAD superfamily hydrolase
MKLAIIDLDGVVVDASKRFERAEKIRQDYLYPDSRDATDIYWRAALDPAYVYMDVPIPGAIDLLDSLANDRGYLLLYLASRPANMRQETALWFQAHAIQIGASFAIGVDWLVMKAPAFQYTKTPVWKAGMVHTLIELFGVNEEDTIYIDDETAHHYEIQKHTPGVKCYSSLAAVFAPPAPVDTSDPFLPDFPDE